MKYNLVADDHKKIKAFKINFLAHGTPFDLLENLITDKKNTNKEDLKQLDFINDLFIGYNDDSLDIKINKPGNALENMIMQKTYIILNDTKHSNKGNRESKWQSFGNKLLLMTPSEIFREN